MNHVPMPTLPASRPGRLRVLGWLALLKLSLLAAIVAGVFGRPWLVVAALGLAVLVELITERVESAVAEVLDFARLGPPVRLALAMVAVTAMAARCGPMSVFKGAGLTAFVVVVASGMGIAAIRARAAGRPPLELTGLDGSVAPPRVDATGSRGCLVVLPALIAAVGLAITARGHGVAAAAVGLALGSAFALGRAAWLGAQARSVVRSSVRAAAVARANAEIAELAPEVLIYFDATPGEIYQIKQWVEPVRALARPAAIVVRSYDVLDQLGAIGLPVICTPYNGTLASLQLPPTVAVLFPTHTGNNLAMIRRPEARTVFVGHGDSDKPDSVNPFARVYDEVWVAGPLGRRRYAEAAVGVRPDAIVEVGRPQVSPSDGALVSPPVIVYAPTWEGWGDDPHHSSLPHVGPQLVAALVRHGGLRVRYRPHPLTGNRSADLRRAHQQIVATAGVELVPADEPIDQTFAAASGIVADVSSVISEWLAFDRPYAVVDTRGLGDTAFHERFPSTAGGFVIGADVGRLEDFVTATNGGDDPTAAARRALVLDALGDPATSQQRFDAAVERLLAP
jgi:hypothetical protein